MGRKKKNKNEDTGGENPEENNPKRNLAGDVKRSIVAVGLFALAIISILGFFGSAGVAGEMLSDSIAFLIGWAKFVFPVFLIVAGIVLLLRKETAFYVAKLIGLLVTLVSLTSFFHWFFDYKKMLLAAEAGRGGGYVGYALNHLLAKYLGAAGSLVIILALFFLGMILSFNMSIMQLVARWKKEKEGEGEETEKEESGEPAGQMPLAAVPAQDNLPAPPADGVPVPETAEDKEMQAEKNIGWMEFKEGRDQFDAPIVDTSAEEMPDVSRKSIEGLDSEDAFEARLSRARRLKKTKWIYPPNDLLERSHGTPKGGDIDKNFSIIEKTLADFGIKVERGEAKTGPAVTQYSFRPAVGVKISKILSLQNDLSLALAAHPIRIEAPIPGQSLIGIEIPNKASTVVRLRDMIDESFFKRRRTNMVLALGQDVSGECIFGDLTKMPHLMIAGATGTGKSVCINSIITSLLYQNSPDDLKFIMVDPKRVELSLYNGIPHLLTDVVVENSKVINVLKWAVGEMERRYRLLQDTGSRDMNSYRDKLKNGEKMKRTDPETNKVIEEDLNNLPYIVIVVDELADLMGSHGKDVEGAIVRIAQMARAVGIHLIVSTQRPSVEVITGLIKANITTRIAFQVATQIDSRTILDMGGAEKLLGMGDMLYLSASSPKPKRIQGVFVSEEEVKRVVKFVQDQSKKMIEEGQEETDDIAENKQKEILEYKSNEAGGQDDELFEAAKEEIMRNKKASASFLQRRLRIGYARAARLLDFLEEKGIVGPADGAKPREIYGLSEDNAVGYVEPAEDQEKRDKWQM